MPGRSRPDIASVVTVYHQGKPWTGVVSRHVGTGAFEVRTTTIILVCRVADMEPPKLERSIPAVRKGKERGPR